MLFTHRTLSLVKRSLCLWLWTQPADYRSTCSPCTPDCRPVIKRGRGGIRTHEAFTPACFQDKCLRPLGNAPMTDGRLGPQGATLAIKSVVSRCVQPSVTVDHGRAAGFRHRLGPDSRTRWDPAMRWAGHAVGRCWHLGETVPRVGFAPTFPVMGLGFEPSASAIPDAGAAPRSPSGALSGSGRRDSRAADYGRDSGI